MRIVVVAAALLAAGCARAAPPVVRPIPEIAEAFRLLYNFDFKGTHAALDDYSAQHPKDALPHAVRASAYLFYELDRLGVLEGQFFASDKRIASKRKLGASPGVRAAFDQAIAATQERARVTLAERPGDIDALFAISTAWGLASDYQALIEKRQLASVAPAKKANQYAQRLLELHPPCYDAYVSAGISEYLLGSAPFFVRWFIRFDNVAGDKRQGIQDLELAAREGVYLGPFARILLAIIYLREKKPERSRALLEGLAREFPANPLYARELNKVK